MSLIERAIGKLHAEHPHTEPKDGRASARDSFLPAAATIAPLRSGENPIASSVLTGETSRTRTAAASADAPLTREDPAELGPLTIPTQQLARQGFIVPGAEPARALNEFRMIKRPLIFNLSSRKSPPLPNARRIMVTSAHAGEGKTFCAINLALSIADERDHSVLLVDADVARPTIPQALGVSARPGLMDALADPGLDAAQLVATTSIANLSLLMSGRHHPKATELLASAAMNNLLQRLSMRFPERIIIFDSPPLLATTEASVLAEHMGQIILVVEAGRTQKSAVAAALATLAGASGEISTMLNKTPPQKKSEFSFYGGYGYGYEARP